MPVAPSPCNVNARLICAILPRRFRRTLRRLHHLPHIAEFFVAALQEVVDLASLQVAEGFADVLLKRMRGRVRIAMSAAQRLRDDGVDDAEFDEVFAGEL